MTERSASQPVMARLPAAKSVKSSCPPTRYAGRTNSFSSGDKMPKRNTQLREQILDCLATHPHGVTDRSGRAVRALSSELGLDPKDLAPVLRELEDDKIIAREIQGRRTYKLELLDTTRAHVARIHPKRPAPSPDRASVASAAPSPSANGAAVPRSSDDTKAPDYELLADSLLAIVLRRASEPLDPVSGIAAQRIAELENSRDTLELRLQEALAQLEELKRQNAVLEGNVVRLSHRNATPAPDRNAQLRAGLGSEERALLESLTGSLPPRSS